MRPLIIFFLLLLSAARLTADPFIRFEEKGKVGLKDGTGKVVIPASFEALGWSDGNFSVIGQVTGYKLKDRWGIINLQKKFITPADYESLTYPGGDRIIVSKRINPFTLKFGCIDLTGKTTIPFNYDGVTIHGLRAVVTLRNGSVYEQGLIDLDDRGIIPPRFRQIHPIGTLRYGVEDFHHKTSLFSEDGHQLTDFVIDSISSFRHGLAVIYQNFSQGLIDREGEIKIKATYREVSIHDDGEVFARDFDEWKILDARNNELQRLRADKLINSGNDFFQVTLAGKNGLLDRDLKVVVPISFDFLSPEDHGNHVAGIDGKYGVIRKNSSFILPIEFDSLILEGNFIRARGPFTGNSSWSLYDTFGIQKTHSSFDFIGPSTGKFFPAKRRGYWGAVNRYGEEFIRCVFDSLIEFKEDLVAVKFLGQFGVITKEEKWLLLPQPYPVSLVNENCFLEKQDSTTFLKSFKKEIIYFSSHPVHLEGDHLNVTLSDGSIKIISLQGLEVMRTEIAGLPLLSKTDFVSNEGLRSIKRDGKYGFVDSRGRLRIANRYDDVREFCEGLAPIKLIGKWGFVNTNDQIVINPNYESVGLFTNGVAIVMRGGKSGIIDPEGNVVLPLRYDSVRELPDHTFLLSTSPLYGLADQKGKILIEPRFDQLTNLENGYALVGRDRKFGLLTIDGLSTVPMMYDSLQVDSKRNQYLVLKKSGWKELKIE